MKTLFSTASKKLAVLGSVASIAVMDASAALTAPDFSSAETDVTTVVVAIIGFIVVIFGFRKVLNLLER